ncbi:MAG: hypothetical protein M3N12_03090 [Verrucomicrobiota bacterium]|nr:hypothetical protein [Verrucomicrobiota bacterium]
MSRKQLQRHGLSLTCLLIVTLAAPVIAANMRSFIEAVRRKAPVVYLGSVKEVRELERTKFDLKARAVVSVIAVARGPETKPSEAIVDYSSYDDKTPMLAGGPQYRLRPGLNVVIFADAFESRVPPGYLLQGTREELLQAVVGLRDRLKQMSPDQLKVNEINEDDRRVQLALYDKLCAQLRSTFR